LGWRPGRGEGGAAHDDIIRKLFNPINGRMSQTTINGFMATYFVGTARVQSGGQVGTQSVDAMVISGPQQKNYLFLHMAKSAAILQRERETMLGAEKTFRAFSEKDRLLARPWRVQLAPFPAGGFAQLTKRAPATLPNVEAQLRLLNGVYPEGTVKVGSLIKVVE
jgi:predicted Zn-dependent protease